MTEKHTKTIQAKAKIDKLDTDFEAVKQAGQPQLFSNPIEPEAFGMTRAFVDNYEAVIRNIDIDKAKKAWLRPDKTYQVKEGVAIRLVDTKNLIKTEQDFYNQLEKIKSGKSLQTLLALWNYTNQQGHFIFSGTRIDRVMRTILKPTNTGYYTQEQKRDFTTAIHQLRDIEITLENPTTITINGKKKPFYKRDYFRLVDLFGAIYAQKTDRVTGEKIIDDSVIVKLYGELLPRFNKGIMRGRLYSRGILELDANKDEKAILLGFKLLNRFDQKRMGKMGKDNRVADSELTIKLTRKKLIEMAEYGQTDKVNKSVANDHLENTLQKLVDVKCLASFTPRKISTDDSQVITIKPHPLTSKMPDNETKKLQENDLLKKLTKRVSELGKTATAEWLGISIEELELILKGDKYLSDKNIGQLFDDY